MFYDIIITFTYFNTIIQIETAGVVLENIVVTFANINSIFEPVREISFKCRGLSQTSLEIQPQIE